MFQRIPPEELVDDPLMEAIANSSEEGKKVTRHSGCFACRACKCVAESYTFLAIKRRKFMSHISEGL